MRKLFSALFVLFLAATLHAESGDWLLDFSAARKKAKAENKRILLLFTGSDWCPLCKLWDKEVFAGPEFQAYAKTNLVLVMVDFPEKRPLKRAQQRANDALRDKYNPEEFPQAVVLDSEAKKVVGRISYDTGGWPRFQKFLNGEKIEPSPRPSAEQK